MMKRRADKTIQPAIEECALINEIEAKDRIPVMNARNIAGVLKSRLLNKGKRANICTENKTRAKTDKSESSRDARTTAADIAAFIDKTDVKRSRLS